MMDKQREEFLDWHFLDWKLSNANDDSVEFAMELYNRVHKHSHNQFFRARELKAWQQAQKMAVPVLTNKMICAIEQKVEEQLLASAITADPFRLDGEKIFYAMIEAQGD